MTFCNRHKETDEILSYVNSQKSNNQIIILVGKTGVGKSGLAKMLIGTKLNGRTSIQVHVSKNSPDTIENLYYINALYRAFIKLAKERFFDDLPTPSQQGLLNLPNLIRFGVKVFWSKVIGNDNKLYEPADEGSVIQKRNYIVHLLGKRNCIVNIDNIQNIDSHSFEVIKNILQKVEHTILFLEYTLESDHGLVQFYSFYNECQQFNADVRVFKIEKLDFDEVKKIAPKEVPENRLRSIYQKSEGNLIPVLLSDCSMDEFEDPINFQLSHMNKNEKLLVNLIFLNDGEIECSFLYSLLLTSNSLPPLSEPTVKSMVANLIQGNIIERVDNSLRILHDSIINELERQEANPSLFLAFQALKEAYSEQLSNCLDECTVEHLFSLLLRFSDEDILLLFPHIRQLIVSYKYPHSMISKLTHFREALIEKGSINYHTLYEFSISMVALCIELGFPAEAQNNLALIYSEKNAYHRTLQVAIYSLDLSGCESIEKAEQLVAMAETPREKLTMELFLLSARMAKLPSIQSLSIIQELLSRPEYQKMFEYAYLLRDYAELIANYDRSLRIYGRVLRRYANAGREDLFGEIYVSMSMFSAYKGKLKAAQKLLERAEKCGNVPMRYLLNNNAVINILEGAYDSHTVSNLNDALLITGDTYEKCIVKSNLLVCYTLLNNRECAAAIYDSFIEEDYSLFSYEEFLHIIYQNMIFYHQSFGEPVQAECFKNKVKRLLATLSSNSMSYRLATLQLSGQVSSTEFYSNFPFRVDFLGNWSLEISRDLERSQLRT